jgi:YegS/Rv2252/BmrU family lipid kinase
MEKSSARGFFYIFISVRKLLFIINPRSGKRNSGKIIEIIKKELPESLPYDIQLWKNLEEFRLVEEKLNSGEYTDAIAVGGDGSVNLTGRSVMNTGITMGILPAGSGNGLARSLGYTMKTEDALKQIIAGKTAVIDSGSVNGVPFFCTSGMGFDAHIGNLFANLPKRGLKAYIKIILKEFFSYQPRTYRLKINNQEIVEKAFLITVSNAGQYGNDFYIAPEAKLTDGLFHVVVLRPPSFLKSVKFGIQALRKTTHKSSMLKTFVCRDLTIIREQDECVHFDGEPDLMGMEVKYKMHPASIKVIVGDKFRE